MHQQPFKKICDGASGKRSGRKLVVRIVYGGVDVRLVDGVAELGPVLLVRLGTKTRRFSNEKTNLGTLANGL